IAAPEGLSPVEAASVWMQNFTALAIIEAGHAGPGDYVAIPAASSSVGLAAIQLANWAGAEPIAATRTSAKADALKAQGARHVIATSEVAARRRWWVAPGARGAGAGSVRVGGRSGRPGAGAVPGGALGIDASPVLAGDLQMHVVGDAGVARLQAAGAADRLADAHRLAFAHQRRDVEHPHAVAQGWIGDLHVTVAAVVGIGLTDLADE